MCWGIAEEWEILEYGVEEGESYEIFDEGRGCLIVGPH